MFCTRIYEGKDFNNLEEEEAIRTINDYYINMSGGKSRPVTEFFEVKSGLSFKAFNAYINSLDEKANGNHKVKKLIKGLNQSFFSYYLMVNL